MSLNFFRKNETSTITAIFKDKTTISTETKMNACIELAKLEPDTVFICWFAETTRIFKEDFNLNHIEIGRILEARQIHSAMLHYKKTVFAEHYPMQVKEIDLVKHGNKKTYWFLAPWMNQFLNILLQKKCCLS